MFERISVIGLGYIGLPTAAVLASRGRTVIGVDVNVDAVNTINQGRVHFVEPDLDIVVQSVVSTGKLRAVTRPEPADAFLVAVPTPFRDNHEPDLGHVRAAADSIAPVLKKGDLVVVESTCPVGTTEQVVEWLAAARPDLAFPRPDAARADVHVAYCPERVLPGQVLRELVENDRVIGGMTPACAERAVALYRTFVQGECFATDARTAEMAKLTENAFRDVNIAFANELSLICEELGINVWELIRLANRHPRVNILSPGPGVGGHCIAVDPWFIVSTTPKRARLIRTAREINDGKPAFVIERSSALIREVGARRVAILGLAFKPDVDDLRESPALAITKRLAADHADVQFDIVEPFVSRLPPALAGLKNVALVGLESALEGAEITIGLVRHRRIAEGLAVAARPPRNFLDFVNFGITR